MEKWYIKNVQGDFDTIGRNFGISSTLARLAVNRGISDSRSMQTYLSPQIEKLNDPLLMKDMKKSCEILKKKIEEKKKIRIIGDYDVDGIMSTYILYTLLKECGAVVDYEIPDRIQDGYGINRDLIQNAYEQGIDTLITCDNGIAAAEEIRYGKECGLTIIVTDHHEVPLKNGNPDCEVIPEADAVVDPKQKTCIYPFASICGAVVVYKLAEVLYAMCGFPAHTEYQFLAFAAIATVCDVMELKEENRIIVRHGLKAINRIQNIGLQCLIEEVGLAGKEINVYHFGFVIGPCLNASGRLETAKKGLELLLCQDKKQGKRLAQELKELNDIRKQMTQDGVEEAIKQVVMQHRENDKVLLLFLPDCHESLAGIIAGRVREKYNKPTIILTRGREGVKGSGRSIEQYHMFQELSKCSDLLTKFGGHPMAAGMSLKEENVDILRLRLNENANLSEEDFIPKVVFDMQLSPDTVSESFIQELHLLEPYGVGNAKPLFAVKSICIHQIILLGVNRNVAKCLFTVKDANILYSAMLFHDVETFLKELEEKYGLEKVENLFKKDSQGVSIDILFTPTINEYKGYRSVQFEIAHYRV